MFQLMLFLNILILVVCQNAHKDINISQGIVRGYNVDADDVFSFYGIPFATAPKGDDKFKDALPPTNWTGIFHATMNDIICPQMKTDVEDYQSFTRTLDCLVVNVFIPNTNETNLPVLVYLFGGAFRSGMGTMVSTIELVKMGMVTVSFNHRVGVLGFLCLNTEFAPGNAGLKDSVLALRWIKNNIAHFGGDPNNIITQGSSSGSFEVELLMLHEGANDLFHKASAESGSILRTKFKPLDRAEYFANFFGVSTNKSIEKLEAFYKNLSDEFLNSGIRDSDKSFIPCVETHDIKGVKKFLEREPIDILTSGQYVARPFIIGLTTLEGAVYYINYEKDKILMEHNFTSFLPNDFVFDSEEAKHAMAKKMKDLYFPSGTITKLGYIQYKSDDKFSFNIITSARLHAKNLAPVYLFLFSYKGTVSLPSNWIEVEGPGHADETFYIVDFLIYPQSYVNLTNNDRRMQMIMRDMWYNFCKYGEPLPSIYNGGNITWPPMTADNEIFLNIDLNLSLGVYPLKERLKIWDEYYRYNTTTSKGEVQKLSFIFDLLIAIIIIILVYLITSQMKLFSEGKLSANFKKRTSKFTK